jgi:hypothetical protein
MRQKRWWKRERSQKLSRLPALMMGKLRNLKMCLD